MSLRRLFPDLGITKAELKKAVQRDRFSDYLPWVAYDPETKVYLNQDGTIGFLWECRPLVFAGERDFDTLTGLLKLPLPDGSVLQFVLFADPHVRPALELYRQLKSRDGQGGLVEKAVERTVELFERGTGGLGQCQGIPVRDFRLFVSLKMPRQALAKQKLNVLDMRSNVHETLRAIRLMPEPMDPRELIATFARLFNERDDLEISWDETVPISKQVILAESPVDVRWDHIRMGGKILRCMTPKKMPTEISPLTMNVLTGDIWGVQSDGSQVMVPFIYAVNVVYQNLKAKLHAKCNFVLQQHAAGSFAPSLKRKQEEYLWATGEIERGTPFVRVMPIVWVIGRDEQQTRDALARVRRIWEANGFVMQEDRAILKILLIASLPFGLYTVNGNLDTLDRDFICHDRAAVLTLPIQADCSIQSSPQVLFVGRKGQLITFDLFDPRVNNSNAFVVAETGSGKSFLVNHIAFNYWASGAMVRIVDIGGSYRKIAEMVGGKFVSFSEESDLVINPFSHVLRIEDDLAVLAAIVSQMIYSATGQMPDEVEMTLVKAACRKTYELYGRRGSIDHVHEYLRTFPAMAEEADFREEIAELSSSHLEALKLKAQKLAFNLRDFTTEGVYGRWFNGPSTLDISRDDFVVLELEELKARQELFRVVTLQVLNYVTQDLYLSDRSRRRLIIFDEAWQFFKEGTMLRDVIEEGYRRARKYGGSFTTVTQSILDLRRFGSVGEVIMGNSAWKMLLQSGDYERARKEKLIDYSDFEMMILKSVRNVRPRYSEVFLDTPMGKGVARLVVDRYSYWIYTSDPGDNARLRELLDRGLGHAEAVEKLAEVES